MKAELASVTETRFPDFLEIYGALTERAPLPMAMMEGAGHIVRCVNPAFCRLLGKSTDELVGMPISDFLPGQDACLALLGRVFRTGRPEAHTEQQPGDSRPVFWSYGIWPVMADARPLGVMLQVTETTQFHEKTLAMNEELMLGSLRQHELTENSERLNARLRTEISVRRQTEEALLRAQAQLADWAGHLEDLVTKRTAELTVTNKQLEAMVYSIAHDLRAPLRAMQGFSAMLVEEAGAALTKTGQAYADRINQSAQYMDALLRDLLAFSRVAQQPVKLTAINLEGIVDSVLTRLKKEIREQHARVEKSGPWPLVLAEEAILTQVLCNLTSNALKFVAPNVPPQIRLWTEERSEPLTDEALAGPATLQPAPRLWVRVWVEDNGIGIRPDHQGQIFRLFTRLHGEKYPGTGIGLALVQKGVERMGGRVGLESGGSQGCRFWFEIRKASTAKPPGGL
jgi:PAS domain S-box-containing protein